MSIDFERNSEYIRLPIKSSVWFQLHNDDYLIVEGHGDVAAEEKDETTEYMISLNRCFNMCVIANK